MPEPAAQQLQQALRVVFINERCNVSSSRSYCQISFNLKTMIAGVHAYGPTQDAKVLDDPAQGGLIVLLGPVPAYGHNTTFLAAVGAGAQDAHRPRLSRRCTAWSSWGNAAANGEFGTRTFQVEWLWEDFAGCVLPSLTQGDPKSVWGPGWDDPGAWVLKSLGYGQENYNKAGRSSTSVVEGAFESVEVRSVGY